MATFDPRLAALAPPLVSGLFAAMAASVLTYLLNRRAHISLRWWELKLETYRSILTSISRTLGAIGDLIEELSDRDSIDEAFFERAKSIWMEAGEQGEQQLQQGDFVISAKALQALEGLVRLRAEEPQGADWLPWLHRYASALVEARDRLAAAARQDLGVWRVADFWPARTRSTARRS